jgi:molybdopterin converting factor small subunit
VERAIFFYTMSIPVLLFASYADAFGTRRLDVPVDSPCSVGTLVAHLRRLPGGHVLPSVPLVAVNHEWVPRDRDIHAGDEVAVIPPVAGG